MHHTLQLTVKLCLSHKHEKNMILKNVILVWVVLRCSNVFYGIDVMMISVKVSIKKLVALSDCLFSQSEGSLYMASRKLRVWQMKKAIFMSLEGAKCSQFLICQQRLTQPNVLKGIQWQKGKKRSTQRLKTDACYASAWQIKKGSVSNSVVKSGRSSWMASAASRTFSDLIGSKTHFFLSSDTNRASQLR